MIYGRRQTCQSKSASFGCQFSLLRVKPKPLSISFVGGIFFDECFYSLCNGRYFLNKDAAELFFSCLFLKECVFGELMFAGTHKLSVADTIRGEQMCRSLQVKV